LFVNIIEYDVVSIIVTKTIANRAKIIL
jgi:hypothetical protein